MLKRKYLILISLLIISSLIFTFVWLPIKLNGPQGKFVTGWVIQRITTNNLKSLAVIIVAVALITTMSLVFQTISNSRILTPNVLGFDAIFMGTQALIVVVFGTTSIVFKNDYLNFTVNAVMMVALSFGIFRLAFSKGKTNMYIVLMIGLVISTLMTNISTFFRAMMDPQNFDAVLAKTTANLTNINWNLFIWLLIPMIAILSFFIWKSKQYDVMSLGKENASNLGIDVRKKINTTLILVSIGTAITTALIGPLTFLGLIAVNATREIFKTHKHIHLIFGSFLVGTVFVLIGQTLVTEVRVIPTLSSVVSLLGGIYVIRIILKENKKW